MSLYTRMHILYLKSDNQMCVSLHVYLHAFDATYSPTTIVGRIHCGPLLLGHPIIVIRFLRVRLSYVRQLIVEL